MVAEMHCLQAVDCCRPLAEQAVPLSPLPGLDFGGRDPERAGHVQHILVGVAGHWGQPGLCLPDEHHDCHLPCISAR